MDDMVNSPAHYTNLGAVCSGCGQTIEAIDVTQHMSFVRGNILRYLWRAGRKTNELEDLKKARWYLNLEIERLTP